MIKCDHIFVEGKTDEEILRELGYDVNIYAEGGKSKVINRFLKDVQRELLNEGNVCYLVDGNEEGYEKIFSQLANDIKLNNLVKEPPYIKVCYKSGYCRVLIVLGDDKNDYRGCLESIILNYVKLDERGEELVEELLRYRSVTDICERSKFSLYLKVVLKSSDVQTIYLSRNFVKELFNQFPKAKEELQNYISKI